MFNYRYIGAEIKAHTQKEKEYSLINGDKVLAKSAFFVGSEEPETIQKTAQKWSSEATEFMSNRFISVSFSTVLDSRMNRDVFKIIIEHENGAKYLIDAYPWELLEHLLKGTVENGIIKKEFVLTKKINHNSVCVVPLEIYKNSSIKTKDSVKKVTKTKLKVGTKYTTANNELIYIGNLNKSAVFLSSNFSFESTYPSFTMSDYLKDLTPQRNVEIKFHLGKNTLSYKKGFIGYGAKWVFVTPFVIDNGVITLNKPMNYYLDYKECVSLNVLKEEEYLTPEECSEILECVGETPVLSTSNTTMDNTLTLDVELRDNILTRHFFNNHEEYGDYEYE